jgi:uncharacterized coiled-coil protein SlyX
MGRLIMNSDMISISALTAVITALLPAFKIFASYDKRIALLEHQTMALLVKQEKTEVELDAINKTLNQHTIILERIETNVDFLKNR